MIAEGGVLYVFILSYSLIWYGFDLIKDKKWDREKFFPQIFFFRKRLQERYQNLQTLQKYYKTMTGICILFQD